MEQMQSEQVNELFAALSKAQGEIKAAQKDSANPFFKSRYADLSSVMEACREALSKNGLAILQTPIITSGGTYQLMSTLGHSSGQWMKSICPLLMAKNDAQSFGAATTYMRRFALAAMVGVCPEDDDGEKEREKAEREEKKRAAEPRPTLLQVNEITSILKECSENYYEAVMKGISQRGWNGIADMSLDAYNNLRTNALMKRAEHLGNMSQVEKQQQVEE